MILLQGDVDAIKDFVFETSSLPQIRGGSELLQECEVKIKKDWLSLGYEVIHCNGGGFLLEAPSENVGEIKQKLERLYLETTGVATVTIVIEDNIKDLISKNEQLDGWAGRLVKASGDAIALGNFSRRLSFLGSKLRKVKRQKQEAPFFTAPPFAKRCEACGKRVAVEEVQRYGPEGGSEEPESIHLCSVCLKRHRKGTKFGGMFNREFASLASPKAKQPPDLDHMLGETGRNYLAFLYADGNNIGWLLQHVHDKKEFKALSHSLTKSAQDALFETLIEVCGNALQKERYWPFEIVNIGGDDVTLLIQAGYAWEVAIGFLKRFEEMVTRHVKEDLGQWPDHWPEKITASCGIAIADVKYPIRYLERLATGLLKEAKKIAKDKTDAPKSALTFLWLPTPVAAEAPAHLSTYYIKRTQGFDLRLTARPYSLEEGERLLALVRRAAEWPRALRHRWAEALERGGWFSLNLILYDIARREEGVRDELHQTLQEVSALADASSSTCSFTNHWRNIWVA